MKFLVLTILLFVSAACKNDDSSTARYAHSSRDNNETNTNPIAIEKKEPSVLDQLKSTRFSEGLFFEDILAEVAIGRVFSEVSKNSKNGVGAFFISRISEDGVSSYPSNRKINLELTEGVDGLTALTYIMSQALWHYQAYDEKIFIVPWGSSEDGWSICD